METQDEVKDLKEKNTELVQKVQFWKMTAAQRENEKLALMKENNEMRLKLSRLRSNGGLLANKLDRELQSTTEKALAHLVRASGEIARTMELTKTYIRDRQELDTTTPRWSSISATPGQERVHRVPPTMLGGHSIQPVVALSRTTLNTSTNSSISRSPNQNRNVTERALPMHMLQDVYIPLTRIDIGDVPMQNMETEVEADEDDSTEDLGLDDEEEPAIEESHISDDEEYNTSRRLDVVTEDLEDEIETPQRSRTENPLEGPSWLLDAPISSTENTPKTGANLEPDSTTELEESGRDSLPPTDTQNALTEENGVVVRVSCSFSPTVRRRKRTSSPLPTPTPRPKPTPTPRGMPKPHASRRNSITGRVLKVMVAKMKLEDDTEDTEQASPPKRARSPLPSPILPAPVPHHSPTVPSPGLPCVSSPGLPCVSSPGLPCVSSPALPCVSPLIRPRFDAPSPNGATDSRVIVSEALHKAHAYKDTHDDSGSGDSITSRNSRNVTRRDRRDSHRAIKHESRPANRDSRGPKLDSKAPKLDSRAPNRDSRAPNRDSRAPNRDSRATNHDSRPPSGDSVDSDSGSNGGDTPSEGRTRRPRKAVTYKEKPLNRKMRR